MHVDRADGGSLCAGTVCLWQLGTEHPLKLRMAAPSDAAFPGAEDLGGSSSDAIPASCRFLPRTAASFAVVYTTAAVSQFDTATGKAVLTMHAEDSENDCYAYKLATHPTQPLLFTAHEDGAVRSFDLRQGRCVNSLHAHDDACTSVALLPARNALCSGSHDGSVRVWDLRMQGQMLQDLPVSPHAGRWVGP